MEKLLEDALIKVSSVASTIDTMSVRDVIEALITGERDPRVLAGLARGKMRAKHATLAGALTDRFDDHHAELARMLLDQIDALTVPSHAQPYQRSPFDPCPAERTSRRRVSVSSGRTASAQVSRTPRASVMCFCG